MFYFTFVESFSVLGLLDISFSSLREYVSRNIVLVGNSSVLHQNKHISS